MSVEFKVVAKRFSSKDDQKVTDDEILTHFSPTAAKGYYSIFINKTTGAVSIYLLSNLHYTENFGFNIVSWALLDCYVLLSAKDTLAVIDITKKDSQLIETKGLKGVFSNGQSIALQSKHSLKVWLSASNAFSGESPEYNCRLGKITNLHKKSRIIENKKLKQLFFLAINNDSVSDLWELIDIKTGTIIHSGKRLPADESAEIKLISACDSGISFILNHISPEGFYQLKTWHISPLLSAQPFKTSSDQGEHGGLSAIPRDEAEVINTMILGTPFGGTGSSPTPFSAVPTALFSDSTYTIVGDTQGAVLAFSTRTGEFLYRLNSSENSTEKKEEQKAVTAVSRCSNYVFVGTNGKVCVYDVLEPEGLPVEVFVIGGKPLSISCTNGLVIMTSDNAPKSREETIAYIPTRLERVKCSAAQYDVSPYILIKKLISHIIKHGCERRSLILARERMKLACNSSRIFSDVPNTLLVNIYGTCTKLLDFYIKNKKNVDKPLMSETIDGYISQLSTDIELLVYLQGRIAQTLITK